MTIYITNRATLSSFAPKAFVTHCTTAEVKEALTQTWPDQQVTSLRAGVVAAIHGSGGTVSAVDSLRLSNKVDAALGLRVPGMEAPAGGFQTTHTRAVISPVAGDAVYAVSEEAGALVWVRVDLLTETQSEENERIFRSIAHLF